MSIKSFNKQFELTSGQAEQLIQILEQPVVHDKQARPIVHSKFVTSNQEIHKLFDPIMNKIKADDN